MQFDPSLTESPLDGLPDHQALVQIGSSSRPRLVASRYNLRASTEDGRLLVWNSYSGSISAFAPHQRELIESLLSRRGIDAERSGIVAYLADRGFLVPAGTDEFRRIQAAFGSQHYRSDSLELILLASEDCNLRCVYCYEDFKRGTMLPSVREGVRRLVEKRLPNLRRLQVSWFGGEPLYGFKAIEELAPFFARVVEERGLAYHSHMTTNAFLLVPETARQLLAWKIDDFQVTIDGNPSCHNAKRPTRDGGGSFDQILANLRSMAEMDKTYRVMLRVNFDQENHSDLESFLDLVEMDFGGDSRFTIGFRAVGRWGGPNDQEMNVCGANEARDIQERLSRAAFERGIELAGTLKDIRGTGAQVCYAARPYNFIIGAHGDVMKCTIALDKEDYNVVGRLGQDGELSLDEDKMALWTEPAFESDATCRKCVVLPTCNGIHCPLIRIESNRRPCPSTRTTFKSDLRTVFGMRGEQARRVSIGKQDHGRAGKRSTESGEAGNGIS